MLPLLLLPSCLWRLPFAFHFPMGQVQDIGMPTWRSPSRTCSDSAS
ncbi:hypothetical protein ACFQY7_05910 [Actinomadura luteofluorescens]